MNSALSGTRSHWLRKPRSSAGPGSRPARGAHPRLDPAAEQAGDRGAVGAVDLELDQFVAVDPHGPDELIWAMIVALELEDRVRRVVGGGVVALALLVPALRDVGDRLGITASTRPKRFSST